jgi:hypothetical protein
MIAVVDLFSGHFEPSGDVVVVLGLHAPLFLTHLPTGYVDW